jgi:hypothetical protein
MVATRISFLTTVAVEVVPVVPVVDDGLVVADATPLELEASRALPPTAIHTTRRAATTVARDPPARRRRRPGINRPPAWGAE